MSFREITMQDVGELLRRRQAGRSPRLIARETGLDRKTDGRYLEQAATEGAVTPEAAVTDEVAGAVGRRFQARPAPTPSEARLALGARQAQIQAWLDGEPRTRPSTWRSTRRASRGAGTTFD